MDDKLAYEDWLKLADLMDSVPDPNTTYTATGWHYRLAHMLGLLGYRSLGRIEAYKLAVQLIRNDPDYEKEPIL